MFSNPTSFAQKLKLGTWVGEATEDGVIIATDYNIPSDQEGGSGLACPTVYRVNAAEEEWVTARKQKLAETLQHEGTGLPWEEKSRLHELLLKHHKAFQLEEGEHGETDLVQMQINTSDSEPKRQPARRLPFAARQKVARQL